MPVTNVNKDCQCKYFKATFNRLSSAVDHPNVNKSTNFSEAENRKPQTPRIP